jgi:hypothetical protein
LLDEVMLMFLSGFFFWWGIGAAIAIFWLIVRYGIPLMALIVECVIKTLVAWARAFMEGWKKV